MMARGMDMTDAIDSGAPTIAAIEAAYGRRAAILWITTQLDAINEATTADPLDETATGSLASLLLVQQRGMNLAEFALFTARFAAGEWGKFYGAADPMAIARAAADWSRQITRWRHGLDDLRRTEALLARREEWAAEAITYEEYLRRKAQQEKETDKTENLTK